MLKSLLIGAAALSLAGCATVDVANYRAERPALDLAEYFNGTVDGWGMFQDRSGQVIRRFTVRIDAKWDGNRGTLDEHFEFSDGERQNRIWTLVKDGDRYTGTAGDVVGTGQGIQQGNAFNLRYVLRVPWAGRTIDVDMDDWMWRIDGETVLNRTAMTKFGFRVGEVTLSLRKR
jgi:Protein of unknown function (DUF3833)